MFTVYCFRTDIKHHYYNIFDTVNAEDLEQMVLNPLQNSDVLSKIPHLAFHCLSV